ncbi:protein XRI1 isoform X3 [Cryptomeria japonica]|uniref:protein XRI1 isoform X3 n=1 Tax=Cryptomeria japonica TaxID=3369 RepID=UPI0027DA8429|nr:protein XRI1 isoform X3 [Cryptomeria japonica]
MDANNDSWDWIEESLTLDADSPLVISQSLWDEWAQSEADAQTLFTSTPPSSEVAELTMPTSSIANKQAVELEVTDNQETCEKDSPRCKRRRMLLFSGDHSGTDISSSDPIQQFEEATALNGCGSDLLSGYEEMQVPDSGSVALWFSENFYYANEASENWMLGYIQEREGLNLDSHEQLCVPVPVCSNPEKEVSLPGLQSTASAQLPLSVVSQGKPKLATPVAYPFAVVKPSGVEGDVTLKDINQRILMPPTRPIQHPVGDHAKPPSAASTGSGLSGKAVVALTKIHTEGKGTITIMRTKG